MLLLARVVESITIPEKKKLESKTESQQIFRAVHGPLKFALRQIRLLRWLGTKKKMGAPQVKPPRDTRSRLSVGFRTRGGKKIRCTRYSSRTDVGRAAAWRGHNAATRQSKFMFPSTADVVALNLHCLPAVFGNAKKKKQKGPRNSQ